MTQEPRVESATSTPEAGAATSSAKAVPELKPTALSLLLEKGLTGEELTFKDIMSAMKKASSGDTSGFVISVRDVRAYLQHSGKKVARGADNLLAIGLNIVVMRTFYAAISGTGVRISFPDSLRIVRDVFGITFSPEQVEVLELAYGG